jgi:hypothetical protein
VHADIGNRGLKKFSHLTLRQPNGFVFQPDLESSLPIFGLINDQFGTPRLLRKLRYFSISSSIFSALKQSISQYWQTAILFGYKPIHNKSGILSPGY